MIRITLLLSLILVLLNPARILWADNHDSVEADFFDDAPLILTASRMSKPLDESPASVSVIDRQMIESSGVREIADLFRLVPGFVVGYRNGNTPVVSYQGMGQNFARQLQVLVDGRSVLIPSFGGVPWSNLPLLLEDIERIEIIRGPNAVTYGANAFLATINIITRHAAEDFGARYSLTSSDNSNPDIKDAYVRVGYHFNDLDWRLSAGSKNDDGFAGINDSKEIDKINFRLDLLSGSNQFWMLQIGTSNSNSGKGFSGQPTDAERNDDATNSYFNLLWESIQGATTSTLRLTHTRQEVIDNYVPDPFTFEGFPNVTTFIDFDRFSNRTDLEFIQSHDIDGDLRIVYGGSFRRDKVKSILLFNDGEYHDVNISRLFSSIEWRINDDWLVDFGATLEDSSITSTKSSPRLSIIRKLEADHVLRFVASKAKRNPILYEFEGTTVFSANIPPPGPGAVDIQLWQGNDLIMPENIISYEIGLRSQLELDGLSSDVKLFSYEMTDLITDMDSTTLANPTLPVLGFAPTAGNLIDARVTGIEVSINYSPMESLDIRGGFTFLDVDTIENNLRESFPERTGFLSGNFRLDKNHELSAAYYYVDEMGWLDSKLVPSINKLDIRYAYLIDENSETQIELIAQNLLEEFEDYDPKNVHERTIFLRLSGGF